MTNAVVIRTPKGEYTLEFTRETEKQMERRGFRLEEMSSQPMTMLPMLFAGAFLANHRKVRQEVIDEIWDKLPDKTTLCEKLAELYAAPMNAFFDDPETTEEDGGNGYGWDAT